MTSQIFNGDPQQDLLLRVCRLGKAQGLRGEISASSFTDEPEKRFDNGSVLYARKKNVPTSLQSTLLSVDCDDDITEIKGYIPLIVERSRFFKRRWFLSLAGVHDRNAAEELSSIELFGLPDSKEELEEENSWYQRDLIGLRVFLDKNNQLNFPHTVEIGVVKDVYNGAAQTLLTLDIDLNKLADELNTLKDNNLSAIIQACRNEKNDHVEALIPFIELFVPVVDIEHNFLAIDPPRGLIELLG